MNRNSAARATLGVMWAIVMTLALSGCAALPVAALGSAAIQSGAGAVVKTGTEYTSGGIAHRTFTIPRTSVYAGVLEAFRRTGIAVKRDESSPKGQFIVGEAGDRTVKIRLTPLTSDLTAMEVKVKRGLFAKDRATTSEVLEQVEQVLAENPMFARRLHREPSSKTFATSLP